MSTAADKNHEFTLEELSQHNTEESAYIAIHDDVYDITKFARMHPGGKKAILRYAGKDSTEVFYELHKHEVLEKYGPRLRIGSLKGGDDDKPEGRHEEISQVPYGEASFFQGWRTAFWDESHKDFRLEVRKFIQTSFKKACDRDAPRDVSPGKDLYKLAADSGLLALRLGPGPHLAGRTIFGVKGEDITYWHEMIAHEEMQALGAPGWVDGLGTGMVIGLPPVMLFGKSDKCKEVVREVLAGEKTICLAISEPYAGTDVANLKCEAKLSADGKHFIVNGEKKWITNGHFADYFTCAVRTGGPGMGGVTLLVIERGEGVTTKKIKTSYSGAAGTAYVVLEDVKVPVENVLGEVNGGFKCIMANFNHERWFICVIVIFGTRKIIEECFRWAMQRKVFGKPLMNQPVIRQKLAKMVAMNESVYSWCENITYQMCNMDYAEQTFRLAGPIALLKMQATNVAYSVSDEACQIFGGRAITRTGMGKNIEAFQRSIKFGAILGGSTEIMAELGMRMAQRFYPSNAKL